MRFVGAEVVDNLVGVGAWVDLRIDGYNPAVLADHVGDPLIKPENRNAVVGAVGLGNLPVGIEQQGKRQAILFREGPMRVGAVDTAPENRDSPVL